MKWNESQQKAIEQRETNILVSAAAGSGKTAVLVERIKKLIIEEGISIDHMLVVTFTNAAAAEMKEKIRKALNEEIDKEPANSQRLREQLDLLSRANISTFHAFALEVIRTYFYLIDMEPGFSICDNAQSTIIKEDAMDQLMEEKFVGESEGFYQFLNWYTSDRNQNKAREIISNTYNVLQSLPYPWQWLDDHINLLSMNVEEFKESEIMEQIWTFIRESLSEATSLLENAIDLLSEAGLNRLGSKVEQEELESYKMAQKMAETNEFDQLAELLANFGTLRLVAGKEEKEDYELIKELVASYRTKAKKARESVEKLLFVETLETQIEEMNQTVPVAQTLRQLLMDFAELFTQGKAAKKLIDFNDIEHRCLEILLNQEAAQHYREKFEYIFVDEYQDTNVLQEEIVSKIKRENNLFMVGDIKQSIYKFRLAEPSIFKGKYNDFSKESDETSVKIDLNRNYRSKPVILNEINYIFEDLMADYDDDARLYHGIPYDGQFNYLPEIKLIDMGSIDEEDEELAGLKAAEVEALSVCQMIKENLGKTIFDTKAGVERELQLRDIVILMRSTKNYGDVFYQVMKGVGIETFVDDNEGYFDTMEINIFMNLLSVIDNKLQDVPLISVLHSDIFDFSTEELGIIRAAHRQGAYTDGFLWYAENGEDLQLKAKSADALEAIKKWKTASASMPLGKFIWKLMLETNHYLVMGAMPGGEQRQGNLRVLVDKAEKFSEDKQSSLYNFMRYIDAVKHRKVTMGQVKLVGEADNLVRIMTIHKSKGLEFPMVIVAGMGRRLNYTKVGKGVVFHKDIGIGMTLANFEEHWYKQTLLQKLIQRQIHREEVEEEIRVLYVALTRARDILYMTGTVKDGEKFRENMDSGMQGDTSYLDLLVKASKVQVLSGMTLSEARVEPDGKPKETFGLTDDSHEAERLEVYRRLNYVYPYEVSRKIKSKYSVSELNRGVGEKHSYQCLAIPKFRQEERSLTAAERGTVYHGIMERIDFVRGREAGMPYLEEATQAMIGPEIFTEEEIKAVDLQRVADFFDTELGRRCVEAAKAGTLQRERAFNLMTQLEGETVMVQGIIDCYFEESDGLVLLDYKTNWIDPNKPFQEEAERLKEAYLKQVEIYSQALETAKGIAVKESYLYLFGAGKMVKM